MTSLSELSPPGGGQNKTEFTASGAIAAGKPVILNSSGTVTELTGSTVALDYTHGDVSEVVGPTGGNVCISMDPFNTGKFIIGYTYHPQSSEKPMVVVGTTDGDEITYGTPVILNSGSGGGNDIEVQFDPTYENRVICSFYGGADSRSWSGLNALTLDGTNVTNHTSGAAQFYTSNGGKMTHGEIAFDTTKVGYFIFQYHLSSNTGYHRGGSIAADGTITLGSEVQTHTRWDKAGTRTVCNKSGKFLICGGKHDGSPHMCAAIATLASDRTVTLGTFYTYQSSEARVLPADWDPNDDNKFICGSNSPNVSPYAGSAYVGTVDGTAISYGDATLISTEDWNEPVLRFNPNPTTDGEFAIVYNETGLSPNLQLRVARCSYTGTTITLHQTYSITTAYMNTGSAEFDISSGVLYMCWRYDSASGVTDPTLGRIWMFQMENKPTNLTATNLMGIADAAIADGESGIINTWGSVNDTQSGMTIGSDYYAQHDGTITATNSSNATIQQLLGKAISATKLNIKDYTG